MLENAIGIQHFNSLILNLAPMALYTFKNYNTAWQCDRNINNAKNT